MIALDARLKSIFDAVGSCECIADIGSDHALLPIALLQSGKAKSAIACDINKGPLERSRNNAVKYGIKNIEFLLSDGFEALTEKSFDKAAICGMGGTLISDIIEKAGTKAHCSLILQPMTAYKELRAYLWNNGFKIDNESYAVDSNKPYVIICSHYIGEKESYNYTDLYLGKQRPNTPEYKHFCKKIYAQAEKRLKGALHTKKPSEEIKQLINECRKICNY